jgi:hypothetical protein
MKVDAICFQLHNHCVLKLHPVVCRPMRQQRCVTGKKNCFNIILGRHYTGPPLWCTGQSSCLQIQRSWFDSRRYQIFWEVVGLEQGPLSLVSTTEELLGRKGSGSGLKSREYGRRDPSRWPRGTLYPQELALTSPTSGGRSIGIVRSRTQATKFSLVFRCFSVLLVTIPNQAVLL